MDSGVRRTPGECARDGRELDLGRRDPSVRSPPRAVSGLCLCVNALSVGLFESEMPVMSRSMITVERLSKAYRLGLNDDVPDTLVGVAKGWITRPIRNWKRLSQLNAAQAALREIRKSGGVGPAADVSTPADASLHWALRNVSLEIREGDVVGLIGRNGAGKSTLLKILSRITQPTTGRVTIRGRVSSLLEVGTGFHPELTGRENVYMNGTILGMTKREIDRKFDEIVDFSGVEKFLETPVKRYSSGMQVRLAFAVAAHLDPEVLIVDEVLAVGDAEFQMKCIGKMQSVAKSGRTVLFVSHNMGAVSNLCERGVVLSNGSITFSGTAEEAVQNYLSLVDTAAQVKLSDRTDRLGNGEARLTHCNVYVPGTTVVNQLTAGLPGCFDFEISPERFGATCAFTIYDISGVPVSSFNSQATMLRSTGEEKRTSRSVLRCQIDEILLRPGTYRINVAVYVGGQLADHIEGAAMVVVGTGYVRGTPILSQGRGSVVFPHRWETAEIASASSS